jgi:adenylate cyclase 10
MKILEELNQKDLLEIMHIDASNIYYRFTYPFMRECIY